MKTENHFPNNSQTVSSGIKTAWHRRCMEEMRCRMVRAEAALCSSSRALASCSSVGRHQVCVWHVVPAHRTFAGRRSCPAARKAMGGVHAVRRELPCRSGLSCWKMASNDGKRVIVLHYRRKAEKSIPFFFCAVYFDPESLLFLKQSQNTKLRKWNIIFT